LAAPGLRGVGSPAGPGALDPDPVPVLPTGASLAGSGLSIPAARDARGVRPDLAAAAERTAKPGRGARPGARRERARRGAPHEDRDAVPLPVLGADRGALRRPHEVVDRGTDARCRAGERLTAEGVGAPT